jgi:hypothetical protein
MRNILAILIWLAVVALGATIGWKLTNRVRTVIENRRRRAAMEGRSDADLR